MNALIERRNAVITSVRLGIQDHGILTCEVFLGYGLSGQMFGGHALDEWNEVAGRRIGTAYGTEWILQLFRTLEVDSLSELVGTSVRVDASCDCVKRIGHFLKDQWFDPETIRKELLC